ncbi:MAG TPA: hypothetical protein VFV23_11995 [Verrucomicrobiae bacterium]|nr:hypothetical protein [Verrucomicrobiae bacterium]
MKLLADAPKIEKFGKEQTDTAMIYIEEIRRRAETVTPLLKDILAFRPPPHWN